MKIDFEKVAEVLEKSPKKIKDLMFSDKLGEKVNKIASENNLNEENTLKLFDEIGYLILGLKSIDKFYDSLVSLGIEKNTAISITKKVRDNILNEISFEQKDNIMDKNKIIEKITPTMQKVDNVELDGNSKNKVKKIAEKFNLDKNKISILKNEISKVVSGAESQENFRENIKTKLELDSNMIDWIVEDVEKNIFEPIKAPIEQTWQKMVSEEEEPAAEPAGGSMNYESRIMEENIKKPTENVADTESYSTPKEKVDYKKTAPSVSFEQSILNQARAMQPAKPATASAGGSMNYESRIMNGKEEKPDNLPSEEIEQKPIETPDYKTGQDPYREPIG
ncbi:MAG: hypothetical protein JW740_01825 [Candidatus Zambryskibacteria bacterium]|nr:hypothetical protein [Candidatus Zambryskibacteria bacterium]